MELRVSLKENNIKIQYCSDLHLEFLENRKWVLENPIIPKGDILILAGDIVLFREIHQHQKFFDYISNHFEHRTIFKVKSFTMENIFQRHLFSGKLNPFCSHNKF